MAENGAKRIRLGMVGGGTGAFIGYVHRIATRLDGDHDLVAGALSLRPEVVKKSGKTSVLPMIAPTPPTKKWPLIVPMAIATAIRPALPVTRL